MLATPKTQPTQQTVWVAKWEHKHGGDISLHATEEGARKQLAAWARETLDDWCSDPKDDWDKEHAALDDAALIEAWPEITGETESLYVEDHLLYSADAWTA